MTPEVKAKYEQAAIREVANELKLNLHYVRDTYSLPDSQDTSLNNRLIRYAVQQTMLRMQVDDTLVVNWITVKDDDYKQALQQLIDFNIMVENDQRVKSAKNEPVDQRGWFEKRYGNG